MQQFTVLTVTTIALSTAKEWTWKHHAKTIHTLLTVNVCNKGKVEPVCENRKASKILPGLPHEIRTQIQISNKYW